MSSPVPPDGAATAAATPKAAPSAVEFEPPLACVRRILKQSLPSSTNCGKDASQAFTRACGIFVIYVTACANDIARENKRTTITANDVLAAIKELDFDEFTPELEEFLAGYRATEKKKKEAKAAAKAAAADAAENESIAAESKEETTPPPKKTDAPSSAGAVSSVAEEEDDKTQATQETNEAMAVDEDESKADDGNKDAAAVDKAEEREAEPMEE